MAEVEGGGWLKRGGMAEEVFEVLKENSKENSYSSITELQHLPLRYRCFRDCLVLWRNQMQRVTSCETVNFSTWGGPGAKVATRRCVDALRCKIIPKTCVTRMASSRLAAGGSESTLISWAGWEQRERYGWGYFAIFWCTKDWL